ncbi:MAG: DUF2793 domain-containing protein [Alphaproteobacteria bacterium]|nr:DUF2793 domain-containing protein [Alphaproteobacteria bacterium]
MANTPTIAMPYLVASQVQKEVTHNDALNDLDFTAQASAHDRDLNAPPGSPAQGDCYVIGPSPSGAWSGSAGALAGYYSGWRIKTPSAGWRAWLRDEGRLAYYTGSGWGNLATPFLEGAATWDPANLADGAGETSAAITVTGAAFGDFAFAAAPYDLQGITCTAYVSAADTVRIRIQNETGGAIDLASGAWKVRVIKQ